MIESLNPVSFSLPSQLCRSWELLLFNAQQWASISFFLVLSLRTTFDLGDSSLTGFRLSFSFVVIVALNEPNIQSKISSEDKEAIERAIKDSLEWMDANQNAEKEQYADKQKEVEQVCNPIMTKVYQAGGGAEGAGEGGMPDMSGMGGMPGGMPGMGGMGGMGGMPGAGGAGGRGGQRAQSCPLFLFLSCSYWSHPLFFTFLFVLLANTAGPKIEEVD